MTAAAFTTGADVRGACRSGQFTKPTPGLALGYVQANLVILPREWAFDFLLFCQRNPKPCPLLDVTEPGDPVPRGVAPGADLRTDLPAYRVFKRGELIEEPKDVNRHWRDDLVALLLAHNIPCAPVREIDEVAADPELSARNLVRDGTIADQDDIKVLGSAIKMSGLNGDEIPPHVPELGEHTTEVLQRLGVSADQLDVLRRDGII